MNKPVITTQEIWAQGATPPNKLKPVQTKISQGWSYGEKPPHNEFNWFFDVTSEMFLNIQENGVPSWSGDISYNTSALAWYDNKTWKSLEPNNTNHIPMVSSLWWKELTLSAFIPTLDTPVLSGVSEAFEETSIEIIIDNYDSLGTYTLYANQGTYYRTGDTITWNIPDVPIDTNTVMEVYIDKLNYYTSVTGEHNVLIKNISIVDDQILLYNSITMDAFDDLVNTELSSLDAVEVDTTDVLDNAYTSTTSTIYLDNNMVDVQVGETITTDNESFVVQAVDNDGNYTDHYTKYWVTPVSILSQIPVTAYLNTHRARSTDVIQDGGDNDWTGINNSSTIENPIDVRDDHRASGTSIIYLDNSRVEARVGETYCSELGDTFIVETINNDGTKNSIDGVDIISCGVAHTMVIRNGGEVWGTGGNAYGQLGTGNNDNESTFIREDLEIEDAEQIACGEYFTIIIRNGGEVWGTGYNSHGQLGLDNTGHKNTFLRESQNFTDAKQVACGLHHTAVIRNLGQLWSSGLNDDGELGLNNRDPKSTLTRESQEFTDIERVSAGQQYTSVIKDGQVWGTGNNGSGELGTNNKNNQSTLTREALEIEDAEQIACGYFHTVIIRDGGQLWTTGRNNYGQHGNGTNNNKSTFTRESQEFTDVDKIATGRNQTIIARNGQVWGVGRNDHGQLGIGNVSTQYLFIREVENLTNVTNVACSEFFSMAISDQQVWGTGENALGRLGTNDTTDRRTFSRDAREIDDVLSSSSYYLKYWVNPVENLQAVPFKVYPLVNITLKTTEEDVDLIPDNIDLNSIVGGTDMIDLDWASTTTSVYIDNEFFNVKMGDTYVSDTGEPFSVEVVNNDGNTILTNVKVVAVGEYHTMVIRNNGEVWGTGKNYNGELGSVGDNYRSKFTRESRNIDDALGISCGDKSTMIIREGGQVWGTGENNYGELGTNDQYDRTKFTRESQNFTGVTDISCGHNFTMIVKSGEVWSTGRNYGQFGINNTNNKKTFTREILHIDDAEQIACGHDHAMIIREGGQVWGAGLNDYGQLAINNRYDQRTFIREYLGIHDAEQIACGKQITMIVKSGQAWGSGVNGDGELGNDHLSYITTFTRESLHIDNVEQVACGRNYSMLISNGQVYGTGRNPYGPLGTDDTSEKHNFTRDDQNTINAEDISCGGNYGTSMIIKDGQVWGSGYNYNGELGTNNRTNYSIFTRDDREIDDVVMPKTYHDRYWITPTKPLTILPTAVYTYTPTVINQEFKDEIINPTRSFKTIVYLPDLAKMEEFTGTLLKTL